MAINDLSHSRRHGDQHPEDDLGPPRSQRRLAVLAGVLVLSLYALVRVLPEDPMLYQKVASAFSPRRDAVEARLYAHLRKHDPLLGSLLPIPPAMPASNGRGSRGSSATSAAPRRLMLVVMVGACTKCVAPVLHLANDTMMAYPSLGVIAVSPSPLAAIKEFRDTNNLRIAMVSDPDGRLGNRYNAIWRPRAYLLSPSGKLLWCQQGATPDWQHPVQALISGGKP